MADYDKFQYFAIERHGPVLHTWINRPETRNALSKDAEQEWDRLLDEAERDEDVRVVTLRGKGTVFTAGHDLKARAPAMASPEATVRRDERQTPPLARSWWFRKTLIAGVHGYVGPAGSRMIAPMDMVIAAEGTRFSFEMYRISTADPGGNLFAFLFPMRVLKQMWLLGGWFDAETAKDLHFVQRVVKPQNLDETVVQWAESAAQLGAEQIAGYKESIHRMYELMGLLEVAYAGNKAFGPNLTLKSPEFFEAVEKHGLKEALKIRAASVDPTITQIV